MEWKSLWVWVRLCMACALTYYVYKDSLKRSIPYRNLWIIVTFVFFPSFLAYLYYRHHVRKQGQISNLYKRESELRVKLEEQRIRIQEEQRAWKAQKEIEMAQNKVTEEDLELARRKRAEDKARRMSELAEDRRLLEEAAEELFRLKK